MKKIVALIAVLLIIVLVVACDNNNAVEVPSRFYTVIERRANYIIVYDNETRVMYHISDGAYNRGNLFPLFNADGSLRTYGD